MGRNLSINVYFQRLAATHTPKFRFAGSSKDDWLQWKNKLLPAVRASLGKMPNKVALNPEIQAEWVQDGLIKQRVVFDVEEDLCATALVFRPADAKGQLRGILACHGHGPFGKEPVMGNCSTEGLKTNINEHNYDYGLQMAKAGYAVIAIDWRGFGERDDRYKPNWSNNVGSRDICNLHYLRASILGMTVLGMDVHDGACALDYLCRQEFIDPECIGVMGLSFGGTMATWISICDERVKATDIICYSNRFSDFGMRDINFCGSQITPGLYELCDVPDLQGLIAPKPLLVEIGSYDDCFKVDSAMSCFRELEKIYTVAGAAAELELDLFEGGHQWSGRKTLNFFNKYLRAS
jgi:dienelactone hydrolase